MTSKSPGLAFFPVIATRAGWAIAFIYLFFTVGPAYLLMQERKAKQA